MILYVLFILSSISGVAITLYDFITFLKVGLCNQLERRLTINM